MREKLRTTEKYPFHWLDGLADLLSRSDKYEEHILEASEINGIMDRLPTEFGRIRSKLKEQAFSLDSSERIALMMKQYERAIQLLKEQLKISLVQYPVNGQLHLISRSLLDHLNDLDQEIQRRYQTEHRQSEATQRTGTPIDKVLCRLSVDQLAIMLKAADDIKLVAARSFSQLVRTIVPFLSTERYQHISWKGARSSVYKIEGNDKTVVIEILELLIRKVKEY